MTGRPEIHSVSCPLCGGRYGLAAAIVAVTLTFEVGIANDGDVTTVIVRLPGVPQPLIVWAHPCRGFTREPTARAVPRPRLIDFELLRKIEWSAGDGGGECPVCGEERADAEGRPHGGHAFDCTLHERLVLRVPCEDCAERTAG